MNNWAQLTQRLSLNESLSAWAIRENLINCGNILGKALQTRRSLSSVFVLFLLFFLLFCCSVFCTWCVVPLQRVRDRERDKNEWTNERRLPNLRLPQSLSWFCHVNKSQHHNRNRRQMWLGKNPFISKNHNKNTKKNPTWFIQKIYETLAFCLAINLIRPGQAHSHGQTDWP